MAEDDYHVRRLTTTVLAGAGYAVDTAQDGIQAWEALQRERYDLLITDHDMPGLRGLELIKKVRAAGLTLPVILMSGTMPADELKELSSLRIGATLHKPHGIMELLNAVSAALADNGDAPQQT